MFVNCDSYFAKVDASTAGGWFHEPTPDPAGDGTVDIGDIVNLIVGGPDMVVISTCECGTVEVAWVKVDGDVMVDAFPVEALVDA